MQQKRPNLCSQGRDTAETHPREERVMENEPEGQRPARRAPPFRAPKPLSPWPPWGTPRPLEERAGPAYPLPPPLVPASPSSGAAIGRRHAVGAYRVPRPSPPPHPLPPAPSPWLITAACLLSPPSPFFPPPWTTQHRPHRVVYHSRGSMWINWSIIPFV